MFRFLHTADWHLGSPQHPKIYKDNLLPKFAEFIRQHNISTVLCVGDVFDQHNPDQKIKDELLSFLINTKAKFHFIIGNHDFSDKTCTYHSLQYLKLLEGYLNNIFVYDTSGIYTLLDGINQLKLLVFVDNNWDSVQTYNIASQIDIAAWHGTVPGISFEKGITYQKIGKLEEFLKASKCKYFALGDIHKHMSLASNCWYPGALVQKTYGCESGMCLVSIADDSINIASHKLDLPERVNVHVSFDVGKDTERSIIDFVKTNYNSNSLLRLIFNLPMNVWAAINKELIKNELVDFHDIKLDNIVRVDTMKRNDIDDIKRCTTIEDELKIIINSQEVNIDKKELLEMCKRIICD